MMPSQKLTKDGVRKAACPTGKSKVVLADTLCRGLILEVRSSGGKTFFFRYADDGGRQRHVKIGDASAVSLAAARKSVEQMASERAQGNDPAVSRDESRQTPTFEGFVHEHFLPYVWSYKRAAKTDDQLLRTHVLPAFGDRRINTITHYELVCFARRKRDAGLAAGSVNRVLTLIRFVFNKALEWQVPGLRDNPARRIQLFAVRPRERFLSQDELQALIQALRTSHNPDLVDIITFLVLTGARKSEVLQAEWKDIDLGRQLWVIPMSKSGSARTVPLSEGAVRLLASLRSCGQSAYLFPSKETGLPYRNIYNQWNRARKLAGLPDLRIHDLRHSFASFLINAGHSLYEVQKLLGHHSISVTERYAHLTHQRLAYAASAADVVMPAQGGANLEVEATPASAHVKGSGAA